DAHRVVVEPLDICAEHTEQLQQRAHVTDERHVLEHHLLLREERCGDDRQCGVLVTSRANRSVQWTTALDDELRHMCSPGPMGPRRGLRPHTRTEHTGTRSPAANSLDTASARGLTSCDDGTTFCGAAPCGRADCARPAGPCPQRGCNRGPCP